MKLLSLGYATATKGLICQWEKGQIAAMNAPRFLAVAMALGLEWRFLAFGDGERLTEDVKKNLRSAKDVSPSILNLAKKIAAMPQAKQELLLDVFAGGIEDDDPRLRDWHKPEDHN